MVDRLDPALAPAVVANVPIGLALFASLTSQVGDGLTRLTEQAFTLPDDLAYRRHGLIFGARLAAAATRLEITDTVFARNLRNYARQCVFHALLLGHISADDLREATDIWSLVTATGSPSAGASPARMFEFANRHAVHHRVACMGVAETMGQVLPADGLCALGEGPGGIESQHLHGGTSLFGKATLLIGARVRCRSARQTTDRAELRGVNGACS